MTTRIYKEAYFEASHRLLHYKGKCFRLHGHQWRVEVWMDGPVDAASCILVDYNLIKEVVHRYDHQVILNRDDPMVACLAQFQEVITTEGDPTSENLARLFADQIKRACTEQGIPARVAKIRVWESTSCYAEYSHEDL
ncbi:MAG: 6-carboxytetrahydropterin synthase [Methanomicrobiales archaeon]|nr:6-carboxytetrahydropterin synthase [Methanomicrobiales archaeon]